jgi:hypothetical protein
VVVSARTAAVIDTESRNVADGAIHSGIAVYSRTQSAVFAPEESQAEDDEGGVNGGHALEVDASLWTEGALFIFSFRWHIPLVTYWFLSSCSDAARCGRWTHQLSSS